MYSVAHLLQRGCARLEMLRLELSVARIPPQLLPLHLLPTTGLEDQASMRKQGSSTDALGRERVRECRDFDLQCLRLRRSSFRLPCPQHRRTHTARSPSIRARGLPWRRDAHSVPRGATRARRRGRRGRHSSMLARHRTARVRAGRLGLRAAAALSRGARVPYRGAGLGPAPAPAQQQPI